MMIFFTSHRNFNPDWVKPAATVLFGWVCFAAISPVSMAQVDEADDGTKLVDFCSGAEDEICYTVKIKNASSATVMSTVIDQNRTDGACEKRSIRIQQNNTGNNSVSNKEIQEYIRASFNADCAYEVKYNVTNGCTGDTRARIKAGKSPETVGLDKNCGSLQTYKKY